MDEQDEKDKEGIALYGSDGPSSSCQVELDPDCTNCNGFAGQTSKAFKIACLKYKASKIIVEGVT
jgi:hypothetical protein